MKHKAFDELKDLMTKDCVFTDGQIIAFIDTWIDKWFEQVNSSYQIENDTLHILNSDDKKALIKDVTKNNKINIITNESVGKDFLLYSEHKTPYGEAHTVSAVMLKNVKNES